MVGQAGNRLPNRAFASLSIQFFSVNLLELVKSQFA